MRMVASRRVKRPEATVHTLDADMIVLFRRALQAGDIVVHYQPQVRLLDGSVQGFEALSRWRQPDGSYRSAGAFAEVLRDGEAVATLGRRVLDTVADLLARQMRGDAGVRPIAINAGAAEIADPEYAERAVSAFESRGVPLDLLEIEVTEAALLGDDSAQSRATLERLRQAGARIALDDFGTGYGALSVLQGFPIDRIKIDRSLVADMTGSSQNAAMVEGVVALARAMGLAVIAEGVETEAQLAALSRMGCDCAQGFLFSEAVSEDAAAAYLKRSGASIPL